MKKSNDDDFEIFHTRLVRHATEKREKERDLTNMNGSSNMNAPA